MLALACCLELQGCLATCQILNAVENEERIPLLALLGLERSAGSPCLILPQRVKEKGLEAVLGCEQIEQIGMDKLKSCKEYPEINFGSFRFEFYFPSCNVY